MPMADLHGEAWREHLERLPQLAKLELKPSWNIDRERLTCFICCRGDGERDEMPEWLVTFRGDGRVTTVGLHERCRLRQG